ncbi:MAG: hypothetical protein JWN03_6281 [Nocardia sp.]|uniref:hypothetical protein n=1 Tax=Nocardia sp. TaxID=1821 RepID=UPI0026280508|nr:hypothetical protein [Nocardia sp.]MCU1646006.1 hypothetical protein [Nocardia sp.]
MAIISAEGWLITSDVAREVAFRIDVPESYKGRWVLSYLPTHYRLDREQAVAGIALAEMIFVELLSPGGEFDAEMAALNAAILGVPLIDVMCLLALRQGGAEVEEPTGSWRNPQGRCGSPTVTRQECEHGGKEVKR